MKRHIFLAVLTVFIGLAISVPVVNQARLNLQEDNNNLNQEIELKDNKIKDKNEAIQNLKDKNKQLDKSNTKQQKQIEKLESDLQAKLDREAQPVQTAPTQAVVASSGNCEAYRPIVAQYDWDVNTMMRIMNAESGCNPTNHNWGDNHGICQGSYGLFQIGCVHGVTADQMSDPVTNIAKAYQVWGGGNYSAWSTY